MASKRDEVGGVGDVIDMVKGYAQQELVGPLKNSGRFIGFGVGGALLLGVGVFLLAIGLLRMLQSEFDGTFDGWWSFAPYAIVLLVVVMTMALIGARMMKGYDK